MTKLPTNTTIISSKNLCDICGDNVASYYNCTWYIHFCSLMCFEKFLEGYNREIDEIALDMKSVEDLKKDSES